MDIDYPDDVLEFRDEVRAILAEELPADWRGVGAIPTSEETADFVAAWRKTLFRRNLLGVNWPQEYGGRGLSKLHHVVLIEELTRVGVPYGQLPMDGPTLKLMGNTMLDYGTEAQKAEFLPGILSGDIVFCQGFSEPSSGSDLASVRTKAVREGDEWVIDGQKIWTSGADKSNWVFVLARTDPTAPKHRGISFILVPLDQDGVEVRPIRHMTGSSEFCEVFFTGARTRADLVIGEVNAGWGVTRTLLTYERADEAATNPILFRAELDRLVVLARSEGRLDDPVIRQRIARCYARVEIMRYMGYSILTDVLDNKGFGSAASVSKLYWSEYHRETTELALDIEGLGGMAPVGKGPSRMMRTDDPGADPMSSNSWWQVSLNARAGTIYAGTSEVQRTIIAEQLLGLPRQPLPAAGRG